MSILGPVSAGLGLAGGILSADENRSASTDAGNAQKSAISAMIAKLDAVGMPPDQSAALILDQYKQAGILTPQLESQIHDSISQFSNIKRDDATRSMQVNALKQMSQYGKAGLTPDERAAMRLAQNDVQRQNEANQQSIIQNMQSRGMQGSGAEMAARLGGAQGSANNASEQADRVSSMAAQRALAAISQGNTMAGQLRTQDFGEEGTKASAQDQMNRFNTQNQMAINQRNVATGNRDQEANLINKQSISNANTGQNNQEKYNQLQRQRQGWLDKMQYAQAYQSPLREYGNASAQQAYGEDKARSQGISSAFGGLSSYLSGAGGKSVAPDEENAKKNGINYTGGNGNFGNLA